MPQPLKLTIEVEQGAFGKVFATLDRMAGVVSIHLHGKGPKTATAKIPKKTGKPWTPARRRKFKATMAKKNGAKT